MKNLTKLFLPLLIAFALSTAHGQGDTLRINLGMYPPGSITSVQKNQQFKLLIIENRIPSVAYGVEISSEMQLLPALSYDASGGQNNPDMAEACEKLKGAYMKVYNYATSPEPPIDEKDEAKLMPLVEALKAALKDSECNDAALIASADSLLLSTTHTVIGEIKVGTAQKVTIKITRGDKVWTFIYKGRERGQWVPTYGFGFTSNAFEKSTYYTKQIADTTTFEILKARTPNVADMSYIPAIFYSFFPAQDFDNTLNHSLTAGLGFDLTAPVVFFGYNVLYHHNIGLSFGVAFQQQYKLKDQYSMNEVSPIALDKDQLHDRIYRPNVFVAVNFRFGESPFKGATEGAEE